MTVAQITVFVERFQWFDGIFIDALQFFQRGIGRLGDRIFGISRIVVQMQNGIDVFAATEIFGLLKFLTKAKFNHTVILSRYNQKVYCVNIQSKGHLLEWSLVHF